MDKIFSRIGVNMNRIARLLGGILDRDGDHAEKCGLVRGNMST